MAQGETEEYITYVRSLADAQQKEVGGVHGASIAGRIYGGAEIVRQVANHEMPHDAGLRALTHALNSYVLIEDEFKNLWILAGGEPEELQQYLEEIGPQDKP